jgi:integrase
LAAPLRTLASLRTPNGIALLASAWSDGDAGLSRWYEESLRSFLDGQPSEETRASYATSLRGFFEYVSRSRSLRGERVMLVAPHDVMESDVVGFARQLEKGGWIPSPELILDDVESRVASTIEAMFVQNNGPSTLPAIAERLAAQGISIESDQLAKLLGALCRKGAVTRRPRWRDPVYDDGSGKRRRRKAADSVPVSALKYGPPAPSKPFTAGTIFTRLVAISSFFGRVMEPKNIRGVDPPVRINPASRVLREAKKVSGSESRARTEAVKSTVEDLRLLREVVTSVPGPSAIVRQRDQLAIELLASMGIRVAELVGAKRSDLAWAETDGQKHLVLTIRRKGNKLARLRVPETAQVALETYDELLRTSDRKPDWITIALSPEAPVVHSIGRWGFASTSVDKRVEDEKEARFRTRKGRGATHPALYPMTTNGIREMFHRYTDKAVALRDPEERAKIPDDAARAVLRRHLHPHGLRHLYTQILLESGVQPRIVAAELGHVDERTVLRVYAPPVDTTKLDFGPLVAAAMGSAGVPRTTRAPAFAVERTDTMPTDHRAFEEPPVVRAVGGGLGEQATFPPAPLWAYDQPPVVVSANDERALIDEGRAPREAVGAGHLPRVMAEDRFATGLFSLLPYQVLEMRGQMVANAPPPAPRLIVPMICADLDVNQVRVAGGRFEAVKSEVCATKEDHHFFDRWSIYLVFEAHQLAARMADSGMSWLKFKDPEPDRKGDESAADWAQRIRSSYARAHDLEDGILYFMKRRRGLPPDPMQLFVPNASSTHTVGLNERRVKLLKEATAEVNAGRPLNLQRLFLAVFLPWESSFTDLRRAIVALLRSP